MGEVVETLPEHLSWLAARIAFVIVVAFQFFSRWLEQLKKGGGNSAAATRLRGEIKDILKEASSLSQPSTFAQAAILRRIAAAKEKELANWKAMSWRAGGVVNENVMVGIIPWLILSTRVSKFVCRLAKF